MTFRGETASGDAHSAASAGDSLESVASSPGGLSRGLKERHVILISLGGAMGVGLFLGSARAIHDAGPALILAYAIAGSMVFVVVRALGELLLYRPVAGSFATYAEEFIGPWAGFMTGWSYWLQWILAGIAEITAIGIYVRYWFPGVPQWIPALIALLILYAANMCVVRIYGEIEFWISLIKITAILAVIAIGLAVMGFGIHAFGDARLSNLWSHGGFFPMGRLRVLTVLPIATFAFGGIELIGVTAGEAQNPARTIPRAIDATFYRIMLFYVGALTVILSLVSWNRVDANTSPFVVVFADIGIPFAAGVMNLVVISAAASACNSGIFSCGRMLHTLARAKQAAPGFARTNSNHVPAYGITFSVALMLVGVFLNYVIPAQIFGYILGMVVITQLWTWVMIITAHLGFRRAVKAGAISPVPYRLQLSPYVNWLVLGYIAFIVVFVCVDPETRTLTLLMPLWFCLLGVGYAYTRHRPSMKARIH
jgi:amino acid transporter, AAT family